jgi:ferritin-like metal-binding protein YciE
MAKEAKKLDELFHDTLKDIYFAEKKILATLPKIELHPVRLTPA